MNQYHVSIQESGTTNTVAYIKFLAENDQKALDKIHGFAKAMSWEGGLQFIWHKHIKNTLEIEK